MCSAGYAFCEIRDSCCSLIVSIIIINIIIIIILFPRFLRRLIEPPPYFILAFSVIFFFSFFVEDLIDYYHFYTISSWVKTTHQNKINSRSRSEKTYSRNTACIFYFLNLLAMFCLFFVISFIDSFNYQNVCIIYVTVI